MKINGHIPLKSLYIILLIISLPGVFNISYGQSNCPNSNFSLGNFSNWEAYYGYFDNPAAYKGVAYSRHTIMQGSGSFDPETCGMLSTVPPGEQFAARLGNSYYGAEAEQLRYTLNVTNENNLFIYKYAVVLQDPGHVPANQPNFTIEVKNIRGNLIDPVCGYFYVSAQQGLPGWNNCGTTIWKDWTTVGLDLSPYIGQTVTIVFTTRDCSQTGHFGYAYISTTCAKLEMTVSYCPQNTSAVLSAPPGFTYLWSTGEKTQSIIINNPVAGSVESCLLTAVNGCQVTIHAIVQPTKVIAEFNFTSQCVGDPVPFNDISTINQNAITNWEWDFGDNTPIVSHLKSPSHPYAAPGDYNVRLIAYSSDGCSSSITKKVTIFPRPNPTITGTATICEGSKGITYTTEPGKTGYKWTVSVGGEIKTGEKSNTITVDWNNAGTQKLTVNYNNEFGCSALLSTEKLITVNPLPKPTITGPAAVCDGVDAEYKTEPGMTGYLWKSGSPDGQIISGATTETFKIRWKSPGLQPISVNYTNSNGCTATFSTEKKVVVNPLPVPGIIGEEVFCEGTNEAVFTTESSMSEYAWDQIGGKILSGENTNSVTIAWITPGKQKVSVNYKDKNGCTALQKTEKKIIINPMPKPSISGSAKVCELSKGNVYKTEDAQNYYSWEITNGKIISGINTNVISVDWDKSGSIKINYTNEFGCTAMQPTELAVTADPLPIPTITGKANVCVGDNTEKYTTEPGMQNYTWSNPYDGTIVSGESTNIITVNWEKIGEHSLSVNYTNSNGCTALAPTDKKITVNTLPVPVIIGSDVYCAGTKGTRFETDPSMSGYLWSVLSGDSYAPTGQSNVVLVDWNISGNREIGVNYTDKNGCTALIKTVKKVLVNPLPVPTITGSAGECEATTGVIYSTEGSMDNYKWEILPNNAGKIAEGDKTNLIKVDWNQFGNQNVSVNYTDQNGCTGSSATVKNVIIHKRPLPNITGLASVCEGDINVEYKTEPSMNNYVWSIDPDEYIYSGTKTNDVLINWISRGNHILSLNYTDNNGCQALIPAKLNVQVNPMPIPTITGPEEVWIGGTYNFQTEDLMSKYIWELSPEGTFLSGTDKASVSVQFSQIGRQWMKIIYTDQNGCTASKSGYIDIKVINPQIKHVEGFSPNGDGLNDLLVFKGLENYPKSQLLLFNPSGVLIYQSDDYKNDWDGKIFNGTTTVNTLIMNCVYYYVLSFGGTNSQIKGFVYIGY